MSDQAPARQNHGAPAAMASASGAARKARLRDVIVARSLIRGRTVTLASGAQSRFYFDMKPTLFDPEGASLAAALVFDAATTEPVDFIGGMELGGVPIVACVCQHSFAQGRPLPGFFVRKEVKGHGTQRLIEGLGETIGLEGRDVALAEDVTTTGGSILKAVHAVRAAGGRVRRVVTLVDRQAGAAAALAAEGIAFVPLLSLDDFAL